MFLPGWQGPGSVGFLGFCPVFGLGTRREFGITQQYPLLAQGGEDSKRQLRVAAFQVRSREAGEGVGTGGQGRAAWDSSSRGGSPSLPLPSSPFPFSPWSL